jgi:phosphate/sulfate permease
VSLTSYLDIVLVLVAAACALALGAPPVGVAVGAVAWILVRGASLVADRRIAEEPDARRQLGLGVALRMLRVWVLACVIIAVGLTSDRADALAAALIIFGAFSLHFVVSAVAHRQRKRMSA